MFRYWIDVGFDRLGTLFIKSTREKKENVISVSELERLELVRKLKEANKVKKYSRTESTIEYLSFRAL